MSQMGQKRQINGGRDESASPSIATKIVHHGDRCGGPSSTSHTCCRASCRLWPPPEISVIVFDSTAPMGMSGPPRIANELMRCGEPRRGP
jgi:hypothetical protein